MPCAEAIVARARDLHGRVRQGCRYDRNLQHRQGTQQDRESNVTHGLILSDLIVTGSSDLTCFLEKNGPTAICGDLQLAGQQPMGTGQKIWETRKQLPGYRRTTGRRRRITSVPSSNRPAFALLLSSAALSQTRRGRDRALLPF